MENLHLKLEGDQKELIVREGTAPAIRLPKGYSITASIASVVDFYIKRNSNPTLPITALNSYLSVDKNKATILLVVNDVITEETISITGALKEDKDFIDLGINENKLFSEKDLETILRKRPYLFASTEMYEKVMKSLRNFTSDVRIQFSKEDNRVGTAKVSGQVEIKTDGMESELQLKISPWLDMEKQTYNVKIYVTSDGGFAKFYLESVDLMLQKDELKEKALENAIEKLSELPILYI